MVTLQLRRFRIVACTSEAEHSLDSVSTQVARAPMAADAYKLVQRDQILESFVAGERNVLFCPILDSRFL